MRSFGRTLTRRELLRRSAQAAVGAAAALVVGCGADEEPAPPPQAESQRQPQAQPQAQPAPAPTAQQQAKQQAAQEAPQEQAQPEPQATRQQAVPQAEQQQVEQTAAADAASGRRRLIPELPPGDYVLEDPAFAPLAGASAEWGEIEGAGYRIEIPNNWNGDLVLWGHGFSGLNEAGDGPTRELSFEMPDRGLLLATGTGWATSTYRASGYVPGLGVDDLLLVKDRAGELYGAPHRTFCAGGSMGGATAQLMAQEFPEEIAGAIALCGALGNVWVTDYLAAWHTLALWLIGAPPARVDAAGLIAWGSQLGYVDDDGRLRLSEDGEHFAALIEHLTGGPRWGFREGLAGQWETSFAVGALVWPDLIDAAPFAPGERIELGDRAVPSDTTAFRYAAEGVDLDLERLNAEVARVAAPAARRSDPGVGVPSGRLDVPLLCLKTTGDLFTPIHLDRDYQRLVGERGNAENLAVRAVRRAGHCTFAPLELAAALAAFTVWLDSGALPAGEDLGGDLEGAGAAFTLVWDGGDPLRPGGG